MMRSVAMVTGGACSLAIVKQRITACRPRLSGSDFDTTSEYWKIRVLQPPGGPLARAWPVHPRLRRGAAGPDGDVDAHGSSPWAEGPRDKPGRGDRRLLAISVLQPISREPDSPGLDPAIHGPRDRCRCRRRRGSPEHPRA